MSFGPPCQKSFPKSLTYRNHCAFHSLTRQGTNYRTPDHFYRSMPGREGGNQSRGNFPLIRLKETKQQICHAMATSKNFYYIGILNGFTTTTWRGRRPENNKFV
jgi:hypothetical protein